VVQEVSHHVGWPPELLLLEEGIAALLLSGPDDAANGPEVESRAEDDATGVDVDGCMDVDEDAAGSEDDEAALLELGCGNDVAPVADDVAAVDEPGALDARPLLVLVAWDVATVDDAPTDEGVELPAVLELLFNELELPMTPPPGFWQVALMHSQPARQSRAVVHEKDVSSAEGRGQPATPHPSTTQRTSRCMRGTVTLRTEHNPSHTSLRTTGRTPQKSPHPR
jgi:hypothetical protein